MPHRHAATLSYGAALLLAFAMPLTGSGPAGQAPQTPMSADALQCAALASENFEGLSEAPTRITAAVLTNAPKSALLAASPIKQFCRVLGYVAPQNKFELRLPLPSQWNGRFHLTPCAGFCGAVEGGACNASLARGYASITGNGGHDSSVNFDGMWAANSPNLQEDFAWRHNHVITVAGKAITTKFYGKPIVRSYMTGCSKGGQAVLIEAQRFPEDFDGLLPAAPVYDFTGRIIAGAWLAQAVSGENGASLLNEAAADAVTKSILARCGAQAGVEDGFVNDPASCDWRPDMIACPARDGSSCLTSRQVDAIKRMMSPVVDSRGRVVYPHGVIPGTSTEWGFWFFGPGAGPNDANHQLSSQFLKYMADPTARRGVDPLTFNFDRDPATLDRARKLYDATSFDLRAFKKRGGKMLMWHGLADGGIMATSSAAYYEGVEKLMGGRAQTQDFFRLFLVPGVQHCADGPGLTEFDALTLLENWVEKGQAPDVMIAGRSVNGVTERTRPVYPYPLRARYSGQGDPKQASSFVPLDAARR